MPTLATPRPDRYTRVAIALHWLVALLVIVQIAWGFAMQEIPKQPPGLRASAFNVHKSIGLALLALMLVRAFWRARHPPPLLPPMPRWQQTLAHANHALLYIMLLAMPVAGYIGSVFSGYPVKAFGVTLPAWGFRSEAIKSAMSVAHSVGGWVLVFAIGLHVAAAIKHALIDRDALLRRMWPAWRQGRAADRIATG